MLITEKKIMCEKMETQQKKKKKGGVSSHVLT